jgi:flagellar basal-body rod modification protein FlgD
MAVAATSNAVTDKINNSRTSLANNEQTFLKLLTTQLKNQDPLSPMDSNQITQQIVQMTGVEQQLMTNDLLSMLVGMNDGGLTNSVNLIGKQVTTESARACSPTARRVQLQPVARRLGPEARGGRQPTARPSPPSSPRT